MARNVISQEDGAELKRLYAEHATAVQHAADVLATKGMESHEFLHADTVTTLLWRRIREILGTAVQHWMAS